MNKQDENVAALIEHLGIDPLTLLNSVLDKIVGASTEPCKQADTLLKMIEDSDILPNELAYLSLIGIGSICEAISKGQESEA